MGQTKGFIQRLLSIYKPFKWAVFGVFGFIIVQQALTLISPYIYGRVIDALTYRDFGLVLKLALVTFIIQIISTVLGFFRERFEIRNIDYTVSEYVTNQVLKKAFTFSIGQHHGQNSAIRQSIINKGQSALQQFAYSLIYDVLPIITYTVLIIAALIYLSWIMGLIVLAGVIVHVSITIISNKRARPELKKLEEMQNENSKEHTEILRNIEAIKANAQEARVQTDYNIEFGKTMRRGKDFWVRYMVPLYSKGLIISVINFLVIVTGAFLVVRGFYSVGYLFTFLAWSGNAMGRIGNLDNIQRRMMSQYASIKELFTLFDIEPEIKQADNPVSPLKIQGQIEFRNVSFEYPKRDTPDRGDAKPALKPVNTKRSKTLIDISFIINSGEKIAFVGESGAGKSTIVNLLIRAYDPNRGRILIDGIDLKEIDLKKYRESIGLVEQHVTLFDKTIRYNILFGLDGKRRNISEEKMHEIARIACIDKFYHRLEHGFDTTIGEKGIKLSGGERQRVGIARALIKEPPILIFDEATSNLDTENESLIRKAIEKAAVGRTTIIIAHRLSTIRSVDKIFVVDNGRIVAEGKHAELLKTSPRYQSLIKNQVTTI